MKLESELPENHNGWLIAGKNVMFGNTPVVQISRINGFTYYENNEESRPEITWMIKFGNDLVWNYKSQEDMWKDYHELTLLVTGNKDEDKVYI